MKPYEYHRSRSFTDLGPSHSDSIFSNFFSWDGGIEVTSNGLGHMTKMAAMSIYSINIKNLLLRNQKADYLETWYAAFGTQVLSNVSK